MFKTEYHKEVVKNLVQFPKFRGLSVSAMVDIVTRLFPEYRELTKAELEAAIEQFKD